MKKFKYLVANGCSFTGGGCMYPIEDNWKSQSDRTDGQNRNRFSKKLADKLNLKEINIAQGGGSNDRMFRTTFDWIENNKEKVKDTLFVIGLTNILRRDLWSNYKNDYIISSEIHQDISYIARDCNTTEDEVRQWRNFELKYLIDEDEIEKKIIRDCVLFNSLVDGNMVFFNALRHCNVVRSDLKFLKLKSEKYEGYNWTDYIASEDIAWQGGHPEELHHHEMAHLLYEYINEKF